MIFVEAAAGITSLKSALDMLKALNDIGNASLRAGAIVDVQKEIIAANIAYMELTKEKRDLEHKVMQLEAWEREKERYELKALGIGIVAYALKPAMSNGEPGHYLCANCYAVGKKSFLQQHVRGSSVDVYQCNGCGEKLTVDKASTRIDYSRDGSGGGSWQSY